jgi:hypothetical protein
VCVWRRRARREAEWHRDCEAVAKGEHWTKPKPAHLAHMSAPLGSIQNYYASKIEELYEAATESNLSGNGDQDLIDFSHPILTIGMCLSPVQGGHRPRAHAEPATP